MKKVYTLLFLLLFAVSVYAQPRSTPVMEFVGISGGTYTVGGDVSQNQLLEQVPVRNTSSGTIYVKAKMIDSTLASSGNSKHSTNLCFAGLCLPPDAVAPGGNGFQINAGTSTSVPNNLLLDITPNGLSGTSTLTYRIFTTDFNGNANGVDSMDLVVTYAVSPANRKERAASARTSLSSPYPNPAVSVSRIEYNIPNGSMGQLRIHDMLGKTVEQRALSSGEGTATLNLKNYRNGIYFCSLEVDGVLKQTRKLIVSR